MKNIAIKVGAVQEQPIDVSIAPGTTSSDILEQPTGTITSISASLEIP